MGSSSLDVSKPPIPTITHSITINQDMAWSLVVHGKLIDCSTLPGFSLKISNSTTLNLLLQTVNNMNVCVGHPEGQYVALLESRGGGIKSCTGFITDDYFPVVQHGVTHTLTVRHHNCKMITL